MMAVFVPDYADWRQKGFSPTTARICKRLRPDGHYDVVYRNLGGTYSCWVAHRDSIWLLKTDAGEFAALASRDDFHTLLAWFPAAAIQ